MTPPPSPRLPINTVEDLFEKLKWEEARLVESWGVYDSWNFILTAHHLYHDWIGGKKIYAATEEQRYRYLYVKKTYPVIGRFFYAIGDVANGSKHFDLGFAKKDQIVGEIGEPEISDYDSYFLGEMIYIPYGEYRVSMSAASELVMRCLEWVVYGGDRGVLQEMCAALEGMKTDNTDS